MNFNFKMYCSKISQPITLLEACSSQIPLVNYLKVLGLTCKGTHTKKIIPEQIFSLFCPSHMNKMYIRLMVWKRSNAKLFTSTHYHVRH